MAGEFTKLVKAIVTSDPVAQDVARAARIPEQLATGMVAYAAAESVGGVDDGNPPADPTGIAVNPGIQSAEIRWDPPARIQGVVLTRVRKTRSSDSNVQTHIVRQSSHTWVNIASYSPITHLFEVQHEDAWGRVSNWVSGGSVSVLQAASADISGVAAAKLTTGTLAASVSITAGGTVISDAGVDLQDASNVEGGYPSANASDWLTPAGGTLSPLPYAGVGFFNDATLNTRGVLIRASGQAAGSRGGRVIISADDGTQDATAGSYARIKLDATTTGTVRLTGQVAVSAPGGVEAITGITEVSGTLSPGAAYVNSTGLKIFKIGRFCMLQGRVDSQAGGTSSANNITTIPSFYRPSKFHYVVVPVQNASSTVWDAQRRVVIESGTGDVHLAAGETMTGSRTMSLDGITYCLD